MIPVLIPGIVGDLLHVCAGAHAREIDLLLLMSPRVIGSSILLVTHGLDVSIQDNSVEW